MPQIENTRFGAIEYVEEDVITFPDGLVGFPECRRFVLVSHKPDSPFRWMQSLELPEFAFLVTDPTIYVEDFEPVLGDSLAGAMGIDANTPTLLLTTVTIPRGRPEDMTLNLAGPIVINARTREGRQFVVDDEAYTIKHRVFQTAGTATEAAA